MKSVFLLLFPITLFAQTFLPPAPVIRKVKIFGEPYIQVWADQQTQILVKDRTEKSPNKEDQPTVKNEYDRLPIFSFKFGFSEHFLAPELQPETDANGNVVGGESYYNMGLDYGFVFRVPVSNALNRLSTGVMFNYSKTDTPTVMQEHHTYTFNNQKDLLQAVFGQWTAFADYDFLVFRGQGTKAFTIGAYADNYVYNSYTCCGDKNNDIYYNVRHFGGLLRYKIIRSDGNQAFGRWEISVYAGQGKTFHIGLTVENPLFKKRINPPVRVVK